MSTAAEIQQDKSARSDLFFFFFYIVTENTPAPQTHLCCSALTHFFQQRQNEPQQTEPAVRNIYIKTMLKGQGKKCMFTTEKLAVN